MKRWVSKDFQRYYANLNVKNVESTEHKMLSVFFNLK